MDELVIAALARWPDVPAVHGWLSLSARGEWLLRGERIGNAAIRAFIDRNYAHDDAGRWFFQNGPQRVYVALVIAPLIYRLDGEGHLVAHHAAPLHELQRAALDEAGRIYLVTDLGPGALDDRDLLAISARITGAAGDLHLATAGLGLQAPATCRIETIEAARVAETFGFVREPG